MEKRELERLSKRLTKLGKDIPNIKKMLTQPIIDSKKETVKLSDSVMFALFIVIVCAASFAGGYWTASNDSYLQRENSIKKSEAEAIPRASDHCWQVCLDNTSPASEDSKKGRAFFQSELSTSENNYMRMSLSCECFPI